MASIRLSKGYTIATRKREPWSRVRVFRYALLISASLMFVCVTLAIRYAYRLASNADQYSMKWAIVCDLDI